MANISFNNRTTDEFESLKFKIADWQVRPERTSRQVKIAGRDGAWTFDGNYSDRYIAVNFMQVAPDFPTLWEKLHKVYGWLKTDDFSPLIFSYESDKYYSAKVEGEIVPVISDLMPIAEFQVIFRCKPYAEAIDLLNDMLTLGISNLILDSDIYLDDGFDFPLVTGNVNMSFRNFGTAPLQPIITITGTFSTLSLTINGRTFTYNEALPANKTLLIDCKKKTVTIDGLNKLDKCTGDFPVIEVGLHNILVSGTNLNCDISFSQVHLTYI